MSEGTEEDHPVQEGSTYFGYTNDALMKGRTGKEYRHQRGLKFAGNRTLRESAKRGYSDALEELEMHIFSTTDYGLITKERVI